jgi:hypothetical protein
MFLLRYLPPLSFACSSAVYVCLEWKLEDWTETTVTIPHKLYGTVQKTTYRSPVLQLMKGGAHFSLNPITPMPFPKGNYSILRSDWQIVDGGGNTQTPLTEVYNHHW